MADDKEAFAKAILARSPLRIHLDPRREGVVVPAHLAVGPRLTLEVGWNMHVPIEDLEVDARGVRGTLSFGGAPFYCEVPWAAVYGLADPHQKGKVWEKDAPPDLPPAPAPPKHETKCSLCERSRLEVAYLVAAERVSICDICVVTAYEKRTFVERLRRLFFAETVAPPSAPKAQNPYRDASPTACSFCGDEHARMTQGKAARICRPCVVLSRDVMREQGLP